MASILIIDDEATLARNAARFLEKGGHGASVAGTGREGLRQFAELRPDAVVLDYRLPDMDGLAVIAAIRADDAQVPIIMITAIHQHSDFRTVCSAGVGAVPAQPR